MHRTQWLGSLACLAGLVLPALAADRPAAASPRKEFPLKYRLAGSNIAEEVGYGGQYPQLSKTRPAALKEEPKYRSKQPLYAIARLGVRNDEVVLALDSSGGNRGYDTLYLDADADGRLTDREKVPGMAHDSGTLFGPVKIRIDCGGEKCPQWFMVQYSEFDAPASQEPYRQLHLFNAGYYEGLVTFGGQKRLLAVADTNANGLYNDVMTGADEWNKDRVLIDQNGDGKLDPADPGEESQPLGRYVQVGDRYRHLEVAADGASVAVEPLNRPLGSVRAAIRDYTLLLGNSDGVLRVRSKDGSARVPAGKYRLVRCNYTVPEQGTPWQFSARTQGKGAEVEVYAGGTATVSFGPPFVPKVVTGDWWPGDAINLNLELRGAGGEVYDNVSCGNGSHPPVPRVKILDAHNKELVQLDFHYG